MDNTIAQELYFLIFKYLDSGPCRQAAQAIKEEIEKHNLLPKRIDWLGNEHPLNFDTFESRNTHIRNDFLLNIVSRIGGLLNQQIPSILSVNTLLGSGSQSLLRTTSGKLLVDLDLDSTDDGCVFCCVCVLTTLG